MKYEALKLKNQLCFPVYAVSREIVKRYHPHLEELNLTYTQYICMLVVWEQGKCSVKELGEKLFLDSGTLTPVLKNLEAKGFISRYRSKEDERVLVVEITEEGRALQKRAAAVPQKMAGCTNLEPEENQELYRLLYKMLGSFEEENRKK